jgi:hypothetical protein
MHAMRTLRPQGVSVIAIRPDPTLAINEFAIESAGVRTVFNIDTGYRLRQEAAKPESDLDEALDLLNQAPSYGDQVRAEWLSRVVDFLRKHGR